MKKDIFETAKTKAKNTTMFEINDAGRDCEYKGYSYVDPFISFLESLKIEPVKEYKGSDNVIIQGVKMTINTDHASFMAKNIYSRERFERKPQNRYVAIEWAGTTVVRVYINKEMDADKIKKQISKAVKSSGERNKEIEDRQNLDRDNTVAIGSNYSNPWLNKYIQSIKIEKGIIHFDMKYCTLYFNTDGSFSKFSVYMSDVDTIEKMVKAAREVSAETTLIPDVAKMIVAMPKLSQELIDWAGRAYHARFDVKKQNIYKY